MHHDKATMLERDNSCDKYVVAIMESPEMLKFYPVYLKAKNLCKNAVKRLLFVIIYVPD